MITSEDLSDSADDEENDQPGQFLNTDVGIGWLPECFRRKARFAADDHKVSTSWGLDIFGCDAQNAFHQQLIHGRIEDLALPQFTQSLNQNSSKEECLQSKQMMSTGRSDITSVGEDMIHTRRW